jgi:aryl-alcohol dehydrogenase-like predicted oxidoreductase
VHIIESVEAALRRLGTDHIDLLQLHVWDPLASLEDIMRSLDDLVRAGKVRYLGCSNFFAWQVMKAQMVAAEIGVGKFVALQAYYSIASRDIEREIVPALLDQGIGLLSWSPLAAGLLSGKFKRNQKPTQPARRLTSSFPPVDEEHGFRVIDALEAVASRHGATVAQIALAWQFRQPALTAAVVGARNEAQLIDNLKSLEVGLTDEDLAQLDEASRLQTEYPRWYHDIPLGRMPGSASAGGNLDKAKLGK